VVSFDELFGGFEEFGFGGDGGSFLLDDIFFSFPLLDPGLTG
jgi:hypothetical protein